MQLNTSMRGHVLSSAAAALIYLVIALATGSTLVGALIGAVIVAIVAAVIGLAFRSARNRNLRG